jgi:hypothetical protein
VDDPEARQEVLRIIRTALTTGAALETPGSSDREEQPTLFGPRVP